MVSYLAPTKFAAILQGDYQRAYGNDDKVYLMVLNVADGAILKQYELFESQGLQGSLRYSNNDIVWFASQSINSYPSVFKISIADD